MPTAVKSLATGTLSESSGMVLCLVNVYVHVKQYDTWTHERLGIAKIRILADGVTTWRWFVD